MQRLRGGGHLIYDQPTESIIGIGSLDYHHLINMCDKCGFVFASPVLKEDLINKYYESMSNYEHSELNGARPEVEMRQIQRQLEILSSRFSKGFSGKALDIGMPIRLFPTPTKCRVVPFSRVEPVEGRRCGSAGDSEQ